MRGYALWQFVGQCVPLEGDLLEVGTWRGGSAALIAARMQSLPMLRGRRLYLADTFRGVVKAGERDDYYKGGEHADASPDDVRNILRHVRPECYTLLEGVFPDETGTALGNSRLCLCHIDVDVYRSARDTMDWVWSRMPIGGMIIYDDYGFWGCEGVTALGNEEYAERDRIFIHNLNGQGVTIKIA